MTTDGVYRDLLARLLESGSRVETRNSRCRRLVCQSVRFTGTPLVGARRTAWKNALREWEWFMSGSKSVDDLHPSVRAWWEPWADEDGLVLNNYSQQFRQFQGSVGFPADQIALLIDGITRHPYSRRNVVTTWNAADMADPQTPITNCHNTATQAFVEPADDTLHLVTYQRSADAVCGIPHNWVQMWAFLLWLAHRGGRKVGSLSWVGGDVHLYECHVDLARRVVGAEPGPVPELVYSPTFEEFRADDFTLSGEYAPALNDRAEMVV
jgi:thymidylate synthase